jgi:hypothetical protein
LGLGGRKKIDAADTSVVEEKANIKLPTELEGP